MPSGQMSCLDGFGSLQSNQGFYAGDRFCWMVVSLFWGSLVSVIFAYERSKLPLSALGCALHGLESIERLCVPCRGALWV